MDSASQTSLKGAVFQHALVTLCFFQRRAARHGSGIARNRHIIQYLVISNATNGSALLERGNHAGLNHRNARVGERHLVHFDEQFRDLSLDAINEPILEQNHIGPLAAARLAAVGDVVAVQIHIAGGVDFVHSHNLALCKRLTRQPGDVLILERGRTGVQREDGGGFAHVGVVGILRLMEHAGALGVAGNHLVADGGSADEQHRTERDGLVGFRERLQVGVGNANRADPPKVVGVIQRALERICDFFHAGTGVLLDGNVDDVRQLVCFQHHLHRAVHRVGIGKARRFQFFQRGQGGICTDRGRTGAAGSFRCGADNQHVAEPRCRRDGLGNADLNINDVFDIQRIQNSHSLYSIFAPVKYPASSCARPASAPLSVCVYGVPGLRIKAISSRV